jgi:hypothetical protein
VVEHLLSKHKAWISNPSTKKRKEEGGGGRRRREEKLTNSKISSLQRSTKVTNYHLEVSNYENRE